MSYDFSKLDIFYNENRYKVDDYYKFARTYLSALKKGDTLAIYLDYTPQLIFTMCLCLEKGITYIPIDINSPQNRVKSIIKNSKPNYIITNFGSEFSVQKTQYNVKNSNDLAYIIYTSGTTGNPKGVEVTTKNIENFINGIIEVIDFSNCNGIACITTSSFDIFFLESIVPIIIGISIFMTSTGQNPRQLTSFLEKNNIDILQVTPSRLRMLENYDKTLSFLKSIKILLVGGENFPKSLFGKLKEIENLNIYNMYGPTEATVWASIENLTDESIISIGYPIKNMKIFILDERMNHVENENIGEICISGLGVVPGYHNNMELTHDKFRNLPDSNIRFFKTGDMGRKLKNGKIEYIGRKDNQIKIRGFRFELEEIEEIIDGLPFINKSIVQTIEVGNREDVELGVVYECNKNINKSSIQQELLKFLPYYMIPTKFVSIEKIPCLLNGKSDRRAVDSILSRKVNPSSYQEGTLDNLSREIIRIIKLNLEENYKNQVQIKENLYNLGLNSISFIKIVVLIEERYKITFEDEKLLFSAFQTVEAVVEYVASEIKKKKERKNCLREKL